MSVSAKNRKKWSALPEEDKDRIVRMAWEDRTAFETIALQFGLTPNDTVRFMRTQLDEKSYKRWRRRANEQGQMKHENLRPVKKSRFKCSRQRTDGTTKGWK
ncbi:MAG: TIGR03643 family protein [Bdellovibrionaceae bacterium]|nr:TIGR03643 family protein [Pseudobdellovibrionaceae bacterium]